jgi:hypothetical protein
MYISFSPKGWQQDHPSQSKRSQDIQPLEEVSADKPDVWSKLRKQNWARLLQKVYEVDPFVCPKCQGTMSVVAMIED